MNKITKVFRTTFAICFLAALLPLTAFASEKVSYKVESFGKGKEIKVKSVKFDDRDADDDDYSDEIEIGFRTKVQWKKSAGISSVRDNKGTKYKAVLTDKEDDECDVYIRKLKKGRTYTITIDGIRKRNAGQYGRLTLKVTIPSEKSSVSNKGLKVSKVEFDDDNDDKDKYGSEIDMKFNKKVTWSKFAKISSIRDNKGTSYKGILNDRDNDECEVYIRGMKYGRTYTIKISGIRVRGASKYTTVTAKIKIPSRSSRAVSVKEVDYDVDEDDGEKEYTVKIEFKGKVTFKSNAYVIIKDSSGKIYASRNSRVEFDDDECEVELKRALPDNRTLYYEIVNVKAKGASKYTTVKGKFYI